MNLDIKIDTRALESKLYLLAREARVAPGVVIKEESRLIAQALVKLTPPANQTQGRNAVKGDFARAVGILDSNSFARAKEDVRLNMRELIRRKDNETLQDALRAMDSRSWVVKRFDPKDHIGRRNRYGRVRRPSFVLTTDAAAARRHLREMLARVGWSKAWLANVLTATGGSVANWFGKHAARAGYVIANFGEGSPGIRATATNIKIPNYQRMVDGAVRNRERVTQTKIDRLIAGKAVNLGFTRIDAKT